MILPVTITAKQTKVKIKNFNCMISIGKIGNFNM